MFHLIVLNKVIGYYITSEKNINKTFNNFSFGSCFLGFISDRDDIFSTIIKNNPELWIWLGDAAYIDYYTINYFSNNIALDVEYAKYMFNKVKNEKYYSILQNTTPTVGVWDDHDYGFNDANGNFNDKLITKKLYLDFLDEPLDSIRRNDSRGIYSSYSFGDLNTHRTFKIILLDVRYNKTSFFNKKPDMLGEDQWEWFEKTLRDATETFIFISSGTQILPFDKLFTESWYGPSRKRLFDIIIKLQKDGIVFLSGDIHCAEILRTFCTLPNLGYDLYEITSSGLSHYCAFKLFQDHIFPNNYNIGYFIDDYNFAFFDFNWGEKKEDSEMDIKIKNIDNLVKISYTINYKDLISNKNANRKNLNNNQECYNRINSRFKNFEDYFNYFMSNPIKLVPYFILLVVIYLIFKIIFRISYLIFKFIWKILNKFFMKLFVKEKIY